MPTLFCKVLATQANLPVVFAAGKGSRMQSSAVKPKPLMEYAGKALLDYTVEPLTKAGLKEILYIVSFGAQAITDYIEHSDKPCYRESVNKFINIANPEKLSYYITLKHLEAYVRRDEQHGAYFLLPADVVGLEPTLFNDLAQVLPDADGVVVTQTLDPDTNSGKYGRILTRGNNYLWSTEWSDIARTAAHFELSSEEILEITEAATGIYMLSRSCLLDSIALMQEQDQLADVFNYAVGQGYHLKTVSLTQTAILNINKPTDIM
jgi:choline kinase